MQTNALNKMHKILFFSKASYFIDKTFIDNYLTIQTIDDIDRIIPNMNVI